ncbi:aspartate/glutamate racemase family protein [Octadecabacter sp. 1_MG-2023]|uniref:maleate cis-trans isomerase family protein n=1 Tax=unclassified Octadecabacter TaxID=196158 RepID=UPI001C08441F|nr:MULTISPECIES: aspartate/glutamate racemase family protein [unclassified Octadecabacter]MBU2993078.1 aspartate/glutamate racemase family protein [Octadecabacter sp. B2R22]MDO6733470.1 aspartate/glutamate racemase family protein [Octadecabacter sp. 1_MG-2023]
MALPYKIIPTTWKTIGLIVLQADETIEADMRRILPDNVNVLVSRVPSGTSVSTKTLAAMTQSLTGAAQLFPAGIKFDAVAYGCTSGSAEIGRPKIAELIRKGATTAAVTEPVSALIATCRAQNITRLGMISPYIREVSQKLRDVLAANGINVTAFASFDEPLEYNVVRIDPSSVHDAAANLKGNFDAIFLSCTNLRTLDVLDKIQDKVGKPVMSSNQVLAWHLQELL